ncbi:MAG: hypothetical protein AAFR74_07975, partial [Pseudomonadota bacterium]
YEPRPETSVRGTRIASQLNSLLIYEEELTPDLRAGAASFSTRQSNDVERMWALMSAVQAT